MLKSKLVKYCLALSDNIWKILSTMWLSSEFIVLKTAVFILFNSLVVLNREKNVFTHCLLIKYKV